jgi:RNA polymerase sigma-70 factor (ECF subfamily)
MDVDIELKLVEKAKKNLHEFEKLYEHYFDKITAYIYNRVFSREITEDITSQVFLAAVDQLQKFDTSKNIRFGSWLYKVAHNKIIDYFRKNNVTKENLYEAFNSNSTSEEHTKVEEEVFNEQLQVQIADVLRQIKPRYQSAITYRYYAELTNSEIAEIMGEEQKNINLVLHRALKSFKKKFKKIYPDTEILDLT